MTSEELRARAAAACRAQTVTSTGTPAARIADDFQHDLRTLANHDSDAHVYFVATKHPEYAVPGYFKPGSVVIDPFGFVPDAPGVTVKRIGRK